MFGCTISRRRKGISIFKVPLPNNKFNKKWNRDLINIITKDLQVDESRSELLVVSVIFRQNKFGIILLEKC